MAEVLFKNAFPTRQIFSAGTHAVVNHGIDEHAQICLQSIGLDGHSHIAQQLNATHVRQADIILTMSQRQLQFIESEWPFSKGKTFRLGHWQRQDIPDPYQRSQAFFDQTLQHIQQFSQDWFERLQSSH